MANPSPFTLRGLIVVVAVFAVLAALAIPPYLRVRRQLTIGNCSGNLRSLWQAQFTYAATHGSPSQIMPRHTGADFWLKLQRDPNPVITRLEVFFCVFSEDRVLPERTSFRGPSINILKLDDADPCGADREGNHGAGEGGNVLMKTGDVGDYGETDAIWIRARTTTKE